VNFTQFLWRNYFSAVVPFVSPHCVCQVLKSCSANFSHEVDVFDPSISVSEHLFPADFLLTNWYPAHEIRCVVRSLLKLSGCCRHGGCFPELRSRQIWTILLPILFSSCGNLVPLLVLLLASPLPLFVLNSSVGSLGQVSD
jgi:hypothetical protein